jgi:prephenate dehydrogenase
MALRLAIIGYGRFGRALADLCLEAQLEVRAYDSRRSAPAPIGALSLAEAVAEAELVVLAVPVSEIERALTDLAPRLDPSQLVLDVGSVKTVPEEAMKKVLGARIPWIATHPLFGPTSLALGERPLRVIVCPNPMHPDALARARELYRRIGCEVIEQDADAHDRAMADTHALAFFVAKGMLDAHAGEGASFTPPSFQAIARTIEAVRSDAGHLFLAIHRENPYAGAARRRFLDALSNVDEQLSSMKEADAEEPSRLAIPDLGSSAPDLRETRDLIDSVDRELLDLLGRRAQLSRRAGRAKAEAGAQIRDVERERVLLEQRAAWADAHDLDRDAIRDVFEAILRLSRAVQRSDRT